MSHYRSAYVFFNNVHLWFAETHCREEDANPSSERAKLFSLASSGHSYWGTEIENTEAWCDLLMFLVGADGQEKVEDQDDTDTKKSLYFLVDPNGYEMAYFCHTLDLLRKALGDTFPDVFLYMPLRELRESYFVHFSESENPGTIEERSKYRKVSSNEIESLIYQWKVIEDKEHKTPVLLNGLLTAAPDGILDQQIRLIIEKEDAPIDPNRVVYELVMRHYGFGDVFLRQQVLRFINDEGSCNT